MTEREKINQPNGHELKDWIKIFEVDTTLCDDIIEWFDDEKTDKNHFNHGYRNCHETRVPIGTHMWTRLRDIAKDSLHRYAQEMGVNSCYHIKSFEYPSIVKYVPGQDEHFHMHCDAWDVSTSTRQLSVILYLNTVEEGGETIFTKLDYRVKPKRGNILVFPSNFCFEHKGVHPISNPKYIAILWLHFGEMNGGQRYAVGNLY